MTQHASVYRQKSIPSQPTIGETSFDVDASSSQVHVSPASSFWTNVSPDALDVNVPDGFSEGPLDISLLPMYPDHVVRHVWEEEVT